VSTGALWVLLQQNRYRGPDPKLPWWVTLLIVLGSLAFGGLAGLAIWFLLAG